MLSKKVPLLFCISAGIAFVSCKHSASAPPLTIQSISPASGFSNIIDTIRGTGFSNISTGDSVYFNGRAAMIVNAGVNELIVKVPQQAGTGPVSITVSKKTVTGPVFTCTGASSFVVSTFAGSGVKGNANGTGIAASFNMISSMNFDGQGNMFACDYVNSSIRKITPAGVVTTFAGSGIIGNADGIGTAASFANPFATAIDGSGNLYVADMQNNLIRKITPAGVVTTIAGSGQAGSADGTGTAATFSQPCGITVDAAGNLYVCDGFTMIRKITPAGVVTTFAGGASQGTADGTGTAAGFKNLYGITTDAMGNMYAADFGGNTIRKITPAAVVTTIAGNPTAGSANGNGISASFNGPVDITIDANGILYVADYQNSLIRAISPSGVVSTIAGTAITTGAINGPGNTATFNGPVGIAVDHNGNIFVGDQGNYTIRQLTPQ